MQFLKMLVPKEGRKKEEKEKVAASAWINVAAIRQIAVHREARSALAAGCFRGGSARGGLFLARRYDVLPWYTLASKCLFATASAVAFAHRYRPCGRIERRKLLVQIRALELTLLVPLRLAVRQLRLSGALLGCDPAACHQISHSRQVFVPFSHFGLSLFPKGVSWRRFGVA